MSAVARAPSQTTVQPWTHSAPADQADGDEGQNEKTQQLESGFQVCWVVLHRYEDIVDEMFGDSGGANSAPVVTTEANAMTAALNRYGVR